MRISYETIDTLLKKYDQSTNTLLENDIKSILINMRFINEILDHFYKGAEPKRGFLDYEVTDTKELKDIIHFLDNGFDAIFDLFYRLHHGQKYYQKYIDLKPLFDVLLTYSEYMEIFNPSTKLNGDINCEYVD